MDPQFLPEDEHKKLICQKTFAWVVINGEAVLMKSNCIGSACGAWRTDSNSQNPTFGMGFCGEAGIPQHY